MTQYSHSVFKSNLLTASCGVVLTCLCAGLISSPAWATKWKVSGQLSGGVEYDDNVFLSATNKTSATRYSVAPQVTLSGENERNKLDLTGSGWIERFDGVTGRDANDYTISMDENYAATERLSLGANASINRSSSLRAELEDTGLIALRGHVRTINGGANMAYALSDTDRISLSGSYRDSAYNNSVFSDYTSYQASASWQKQASDRVSVITKVSGAVENPKNPIIPKSRYGEGTIGLNYVASELTNLTVYGGAYYLDEGLPGVTSVGASIGANASVKYEFTTLSLNASHGVSPSGVGQLVQSTTVALSASRRLAEHVYLDANADIRLDKTKGGVLFTLDRTYYDGNAALRWDFARHFGLRAYYGYSRQKILGGAPWANANRVGINLVMYTEPRE